MNSVNIWKDIKTETIKEDFENAYTNYLVDVFENSPNYNLVQKNFDYTTDYKTIIVEYDVGKNLIGYKRLVSYPYTTQQFEIGDYIHWNYGSVLTNWLMFAIDKQFDYNLNGKIKKCNSTLKWRDTHNNVISYPCVIDDKINNSDFDYARDLIVPSGGIIVHVQTNSDTETLYLNQRFIFGKNVYKLNAQIDFSSPYLMTLILTKDNESPDVMDDFSNGIANNNKYSYVLNINQNNFTQNVGYTAQLTHTLTLNGFSDSSSVVWSSSNTSIGTVNSSTGVINLLSVGSVVFTCKMQDNITTSDTVTVTVNATLPVVKVVRINPQVTNLLQGDNQIYTVYKYKDNVVQADTFTITASGVPSTNATLTVISGNSFKVTNIKSYSLADMVVTCISNTDATSGSVSIKIKGMW